MSRYAHYVLALLISRGAGSLSQKEDKIMRLSRYVLLGLLMLFFVSLFSHTGCVNIPVQSITSESLPDYNKPDNEYVVADFNVISGDFLGDYSGKYIIVDGYYISSFGGPILKMGNGEYMAKEIKVVLIADKKPISKRAFILYPHQHTEYTRSLIQTSAFGKVRAFCYVLPAHQSPTLRDGSKMRYFDQPLIWLIRIMPVEEKR